MLLDVKLQISTAVDEAKSHMHSVKQYVGGCLKDS